MFVQFYKKLCCFVIAEKWEVVVVMDDTMASFLVFVLYEARGEGDILELSLTRLAEELSLFWVDWGKKNFFYGCNVEECGCNVDPPHFKIENVYVMWMLCGRNVEQCECNVGQCDVMWTLHISTTLPCQGLEMITCISYNPWLQTSFLLISDYLENPVLEVLSKFSTSHNTANIYGSGAGSY